ncbi:hypothetical protein MKEN_00275400 [Mycena kentingensis (nom. inval.)]|nr:hypothetical protein MKEN_00275400 [Mycena kentingensis (nom. inval.)]
MPPRSKANGSSSMTTTTTLTTPSRPRRSARFVPVHSPTPSLPAASTSTSISAPVASTSRLGAASPGPAPPPRHSRRLSLKALSVSSSASPTATPSSSASTSGRAGQRKRKSPDPPEGGARKKRRSRSSARDSDERTLSTSRKGKGKASTSASASASPSRSPSTTSSSVSASPPASHAHLHNTRSNPAPMEPLVLPKSKKGKGKAKAGTGAAPPLMLVRRITRRTAQLLATTGVATSVSSPTTSAPSPASPSSATAKPSSKQQNPMTLRPITTTAAPGSRGNSPAPSRLDEIDMGVTTPLSSPVRERGDVIWGAGAKKVVVKSEPVDIVLSLAPQPMDVEAEPSKGKEMEVVCVPVDDDGAIPTEDEDGDVDMPLPESASPPTRPISITRRRSSASSSSSTSTVTQIRVAPLETNATPTPCPATELAPSVSPTPTPAILPAPMSPSNSPSLTFAHAQLPTAPPALALSPEDLAPSPFAPPLSPSPSPLPVMEESLSPFPSAEGAGDWVLPMQSQEVPPLPVQDVPVQQHQHIAESPQEEQPQHLPQLQQEHPLPLSNANANAQYNAYPPPPHHQHLHNPANPNAGEVYTYAERHTRAVEWSALLLRRQRAAERVQHEREMARLEQEMMERERERERWVRENAMDVDGSNLNGSFGAGGNGAGMMGRRGRSPLTSVQAPSPAERVEQDDKDVGAAPPSPVLTEHQHQRTIILEAAPESVPEPAAEAYQHQQQRQASEELLLDELGPDPNMHWHTSWGIWKIACRMRVWDLRLRYTPGLIRTLVAQEADSFFSNTGKPHPQALMFMDEEYYDWELEDSGSEGDDGDDDLSGDDDDIDAEGELDADLDASFAVDLDTTPPGSPTSVISSFYVAAERPQSQQGSNAGAIASTLPLPPPPFGRVRVPILKHLYTDIPISPAGGARGDVGRARGTPVDRVKRAVWTSRAGEPLEVYPPPHPGTGKLERRQPQPRPRPHPLYMEQFAAAQQQQEGTPTLSPNVVSEQNKEPLRLVPAPMPMDATALAPMEAFEPDEAAWQEFLKSVGVEGEAAGSVGVAQGDAMDVDLEPARDENDEMGGGAGGTSGGVSLGMPPPASSLIGGMFGAAMAVRVLLGLRQPPVSNVWRAPARAASQNWVVGWPDGEQALFRGREVFTLARLRFPSLLLLPLRTMPETYPRLLDSPITSDSRSLSKYTSYSYADDADAGAELDMSAFSAEGFSDFKLDLTCMSPPASPTPLPDDDDDDKNLLPSAAGQGQNYLPASPPSSTRRSVSFSADPPFAASIIRPASAPRLNGSPRISLSNNDGRSAWTLSKYVGRGTPIDRGRRSQWVAGDSEQDGDGHGEAAEDGVLFSTTTRATTMDSPALSHRSISPLAEWKYLAPGPVPAPPPKAHTFSGAAGREYHYRHRPRSLSSLAVPPLPESKKIKLEEVGAGAVEEWAEAMRAALAASAAGPSKSEKENVNVANSPTTTVTTPTLTADARSPTSPEGNDMDMDDVPLTPIVPHGQQLALPLPTGQQQTTIEQGLGIIPAAGMGMTWFDAGIVPGPSPSPAPPSVASASRRSASESVYSCESSPRVGLAQAGSRGRERDADGDADGTSGSVRRAATGAGSGARFGAKLGKGIGKGSKMGLNSRLRLGRRVSRAGIERDQGVEEGEAEAEAWWRRLWKRLRIK